MSGYRDMSGQESGWKNLQAHVGTCMNYVWTFTQWAVTLQTYPLFNSNHDIH